MKRTAIFSAVTLAAAVIASSAVAQTRYVAPKTTVAPIQSTFTTGNKAGIAGKPSPAFAAAKPGFAINSNAAGMVAAGGLNKNGQTGLISPGNKTGSSFR